MRCLHALHLSPLILSLFVAAATAQSPSPDSASLTVRLDSVRHEVVLHAGAWNVPANNSAYGAMHEGHLDAPTRRFTWPVSGWIRGVRLMVRDANGRELPRTLLHHLAIVNFGRRQLLKPTPERLIAFGAETADMRLPNSVGIPITAGMPMAMTLAWFNATATTIPGARVEVTFEWMPSNQLPRPRTVIPVGIDVDYAMGVNSGYDLPPGSSVQTADVAFPINGRILAAGGHLHDFGTALELRDLSRAAPRSVIRLASQQDAAGHVTGIDRAIPGVAGSGIRLTSDRRYQLRASNDNPTGKTLSQSAMAYLVLLYAPDAKTPWPAVAQDDRAWQSELHYLFGEHGHQ